MVLSRPFLVYCLLFKDRTQSSYGIVSTALRNVLWSRYRIFIASQEWQTLLLFLRFMLRMRRPCRIFFYNRHTCRIRHLVSVALHLGGVFMSTRRWFPWRFSDLRCRKAANWILISTGCSAIAISRAVFCARRRSGLSRMFRHNKRFCLLQ